MGIESTFGIPTNAFMSQLLLGLMNGAFYAMLSLGLAIIFGLLNVINFLHGAQFMVGAFVAWMLLTWAGVGYWVALLVAPLAVGLAAVLVERLLLRHLYRLDHLYGMLLTFGLMLIVEGVFRKSFGSSGLPYPNTMPGGMDLGFMFLPYYRAWVVVVSLAVCLATWLRPDWEATFGPRPRTLTLCGHSESTFLSCSRLPMPLARDSRHWLGSWRLRSIKSAR